MLASQAAGQAMESFNIGRTFSRAFSLIAATLPSVGLFVTLMAAGHSLFQGGLFSVLLKRMSLNSGSGKMEMLVTSGWYWAILLGGFALTAMLMAGATYGNLKAAHNEATTFGDCLSFGLMHALPVLGLTLLWYLAVGLGWILLLVPGIILMCMWSAAIPAFVGEGLGVFASFGRSRELTKGSRLKIFVVLMIYIVVVYGGMVAANFAVLGSYFTADPTAGLNNSSLYLARIPLTCIMQLALCALLSAIYLEALEVKEGGATGQLVEVFG